MSRMIRLGPRAALGIIDAHVLQALPDLSRQRKIVARTREAVDIAARHPVYKLFEATNGEPMAWQVLGLIGERRETVARAVERGWIVVREDGVNGRRKAQSAALTDQVARARSIAGWLSYLAANFSASDRERPSSRGRGHMELELRSGR